MLIYIFKYTLKVLVEVLKFCVIRDSTTIIGLGLVQVHSTTR